MASPVEQFMISPVLPITVGTTDLSFTNSAFSMGLAVLIAIGLMVVGTRGRALVPDRVQCVAEMCYELVANMIRDNVGAAGRPYFPFIFTLFMFLLIGNLLSMFPPIFAFTSHLAVTFALAAVIFTAVTVLGFVLHGTKYLQMFFPHGAPLWTAPILIPIELISYFSRPISLSVRLFANMTVGHILLKVIAGFVVSLGGLAAWYGVPGAGVSVIMLLLITMFEFFVMVIQAYVFTILSCIYLNDAINLH